MLNVLEMVDSLKVEIEDLKNKQETKQRIIDKYERELIPLKQEVSDITETLSGLQMALDSLDLVCNTIPKTNVNAIHDGELPKEESASSAALKFTDDGMLIGDPVNHRKAKSVLKKDPRGTVVREYRSINEAARDNNFDPSSLRNVILKVSKDKQIRQRGCYYVYA